MEDNVLVAVARARYLSAAATTRGGSSRASPDVARSPRCSWCSWRSGSTDDVLFAFRLDPRRIRRDAAPYIVFAANAFALLGLRAVFFLVSGLLDRLVYLSTGLALILAFIGVKLMLHFAHQQDHSIPEVSTGLSLAVIAVVIAATTVAELDQGQARSRASALTLARCASAARINPSRCPAGSPIRFGEPPAEIHARPMDREARARDAADGCQSAAMKRG